MTTNLGSRTGAQLGRVAKKLTAANPFRTPTHFACKSIFPLTMSQKLAHELSPRHLSSQHDNLSYSKKKSEQLKDNWAANGTPVRFTLRTT